MKNKKKGFTIVELVIVIAVIGILAAVLIPVFSGLISKAKIASDSSLVKNINTQLVMAEVEDGKNKTMYDALLDAKDAGYIVSNINARSDNQLVWDETIDRFALIDKDGNLISGEINATKKVNLWKISKEIDEEYSTYYIGTSKVINTQKGFDSGEVDGITSINYSNAGPEQDVVIRTNGGTLTITDTNLDSEQVFYGYADSVEVTTGSACFTSHGTIGTMDLKAGKATADSGAYIGLIKAAAGTVAEEKNGGVFVIPTNAVVSEIDNDVAESLGYTLETVDEVQVFTPSAEKADKAYFAIYDMTTLRAYRTAINNGTEILLAKVTADFDMYEEEWLPIGNNEHPFHGTFDGQNHVIRNLHSSNSDVWWNNSSVGYGKVYGFFGLADKDTEIKNITFTGVNISLTNDGKNTGAVLGYYLETEENHSLSLRNITVGKHVDNEEPDSAVHGKSHVAGIVGKVYSKYGTISIENCTNYADVSGTSGYLGGILGILSESSQTKYAKSVSFENCFNYGTITGPTGNGAAGLFGIVSANSDGNITIKDCHNHGDVNNATTTNGSITAGLANIGGGPTIIENCSNSGDITSGCNIVPGVIYSANSNITLKGKIKNSGAVSQTNSAFTGSACGIISVANNKTLTVENATIVNEGNITSSNISGGFQASANGVKYVAVGTSSFENKGNISASNTSNFAYAGGVFGYVDGASTGYNTVPFSINVHDCTVTATGAGLDEKFSSAGGVVGQMGGKNFTFNNVTVQNANITAAGQDSNTYNYAGGFVGMIRMNGQSVAENNLTNATITTGNTISGTKHGVVAGCAYDSQGGTYKNALNYSGLFASGDALGHSWNSGVITPVE